MFFEKEFFNLFKKAYVMLALEANNCPINYSFSELQLIARRLIFGFSSQILTTKHKPKNYYAILT